MTDRAHDTVNHPQHYTSVVPGIECIDVTEHFPFCRGNAIKYLWRAGAKGDIVEDLRKAIWYIEREIASHEALPVAEAQTTELPARSAFPADWTRKCAYCGAASGTAEVCCNDCRSDKHAHCPSWPSCQRDDYGRECDATRTSLAVASETPGRSGTATNG